ncbi:MAG: purine-nucleoside phosphorylase [Spirochaetia bacterium]
MGNLLEAEKRAAEHIESVLLEQGSAPSPKIGLVLGSGLGAIGDELEKPVYLDYGDIPGFPVSTVSGHKGRLIIGLLSGRPVAVMQGRFHYYEGFSMAQVVFPVRVFKLLGVENLILTNAAGGINTAFIPGDLMLIKDHIKITAENPLRGTNIDEFGPRFNDMSDAYTENLRKTAKEAAEKAGTELREGVYAFWTGPSFETPAEIRMLRVLGADAVGMSTAPEVITAAHAGIKVVAISTITNMAAGILDQKLSHEEVMEMGGRVKGKLLKLLLKIVEGL